MGRHLTSSEKLALLSGVVCLVVGVGLAVEMPRLPWWLDIAIGAAVLGGCYDRFLKIAAQESLANRRPTGNGDVRCARTAQADKGSAASTP